MQCILEGGGVIISNFVESRSFVLVVTGGSGGLLALPTLAVRLRLCSVGKRLLRCACVPSITVAKGEGG
jgi:hypothetical protein